MVIPRLAVVVFVLFVLGAACAEAPTAPDGEDDPAAGEDDPAAGEDDPGDPTDDEAGEAGAMQGDWHLVEADGPGTDPLPLADRDITLSVEPNELGGNAGCNSYSAQYTLDGEQITLSDMAWTEQLCQPPEVMEGEEAYRDALGQVERATVEGDELLLAGGDVTLRFAPLMLPDAPEGDGSD